MELVNPKVCVPPFMYFAVHDLINLSLKKLDVHNIIKEKITMKSIYIHISAEIMRKQMELHFKLTFGEQSRWTE